MSDQEDRVNKLVAMVRVLADQVDQAMIEADALHIAYPQGASAHRGDCVHWRLHLRKHPTMFEDPTLLVLSGRCLWAGRRAIRAYLC
jgi:hypothetical protein